MSEEDTKMVEDHPWLVLVCLYQFKIYLWRVIITRKIGVQNTLNEIGITVLKQVHILFPWNLQQFSLKFLF